MGKEKIEYDIVIRTLGKGGEKYTALLNSIKALEPQPNNIWVILPEGYEKPSERIGTEKFYYSKKGMIDQRLATLECCDSPYALFCDDDIQFESDFVTKLHSAITEQGYSIATGEVLAFLPPSKGLKKILPIIHSAAAPTLFHKDRYVTILKSSGWTYNRFKPKKGWSIPTQSAAGCMFYSSIDTFREIHFEDELWAQHEGLAPADDQIMFYKAHLLGLSVCVVTDAHYDHLSAKSATSSKSAVEKKEYWSAFNRAVFWRRFILRFQRGFISRTLTRIAFGYYVVINSIHLLLRSILKKGRNRPFVFQRAIRDGLAFEKNADLKKVF